MQVPDQKPRTTESQDYSAKFQISKLQTSLTLEENIFKTTASLFVFDCLQGNACTLCMDYFNFLIHKFNTRNSGVTVVILW